MSVKTAPEISKYPFFTKIHRSFGDTERMFNPSLVQTSIHEIFPDYPCASYRNLRRRTLSVWLCSSFLATALSLSYLSESELLDYVCLLGLLAVLPADSCLFASGSLECGVFGSGKFGFNLSWCLFGMTAKISLVLFYEGW